MKTVIPVLAILFLASSLWAQNNSPVLTAQQFDNFESHRKDKAVALFWYAVVPGGGLLYSNRPGSALVYGGGEVAFAVMAVSQKTPDAYFTLAVVGVLRIIEGIETFSAVDEYNSALWRRVTLSITQRNTAPTLRIQVVL